MTATPANCCYEDFSDFDGSVLIGEATSGNTICAKGDWRGAPIWFGEPYEFRYRFSGFRLPDPGNGMPSPNRAVARVRRVFLRYHNTSFFQVEVTPERRQTSVYVFDGTILDSRASQVGATLGEGLDIDNPELFKGVYQFPCLSEGSRVQVDIVSSAAAPCQFLSAEWVGMRARNTLT